MNTNLKKLVLDDCSQTLTLPDYIMRRIQVALESSQNLQYLDLMNTKFNNLHIALEGLKGNQSLQYLNLDSCNLTSEALISLGKLIINNPNLRVLKINNNKFTNEEALMSFANVLAKNSALKSLEMDHTIIPSNFCGFLALNSTLRHLRIKPSTY